MWQNIDKTRKDSAHYSVMRKLRHVDGITALRDLFPDGKADELNLVLFSTSGVHGTYNTIEEAERKICGDESEDLFTEVTFLVVHPRLVALRYGTCEPQNLDDIEFLKLLRATSKKAIDVIGELTE